MEANKTTAKSQKKSTDSMGIDLGTTNTLIYRKNKGIVLKEPTIIAVNSNNDIVAVGEKAKEMLGKTPKEIKIIRPLKSGTIADFDTTKEILKYFFKKTNNFRLLSRPDVVISIPYGTTTVEKNAVIEAATQAGARRVFLIEEPLAAAIGAGVNVEEAEGNMIVNIGGGITEIAVVSLGGIITARSLKIGGNTFDEAIIDYYRKEYRIELGPRTAEEIKIAIGNKNTDTYKVTGINLKTGLPISIDINISEIIKILEAPLENIIAASKEVFEAAPPQVVSDIIKNGIILTGGSAKLKNLDKFLKEKLKLDTKIPEQPQECVAIGTGESLSYLKSLVGLSLYSNQ